MSNASPDTLQPTPRESMPRRAIIVWILKWTLVSLAIIVATPIMLLVALWVVMTFSPPSYGPTESTRLVRFTFLDRNFAIPENYHPSVYGGAEPYGFSLDALLPDFAPYSKARRDEWFAVGSGKPSVGISVRSSATAVRPDELVRNHLEDAIDMHGQPGPAALRRYDMRDDSSSPHEVVYVPEQRGDVILIGCTIHEGEMTGCCLHTVYDHVANLEVVFNSHFLADWRQIAAGAHRLLRSFESH